MKPLKWTDRKFFFGYDRSYAPFFIERLKATAPRLAELVAGCSEEFAESGHKIGWSIKEHIGHLTDLEKLHDGRIDDFLDDKPTLRPADMGNKATYEAGHNSRSLSQLIHDFRASRTVYINRLENLDEGYFNAKGLHPRLSQVITLTDLLYFVAEHDNNHLTRIAGILRTA